VGVSKTVRAISIVLHHFVPAGLRGADSIFLCYTETHVTLLEKHSLGHRNTSFYFIPFFAFRRAGEGTDNAKFESARRGC
jgi:hypothetical protein